MLLGIKGGGAIEVLVAMGGGGADDALLLTYRELERDCARFPMSGLLLSPPAIELNGGGGI